MADCSYMPELNDGPAPEFWQDDKLVYIEL